MNNTVEFIEKNKKIKKACIFGAIISFIFSYTFVSPYFEGKDFLLNGGTIFGFSFWLLCGLYCIYCRKIASKTLQGDEESTKKMINLLELDKKKYGFLIILFVAVLVKKAFDKQENKTLLKQILDEIKQKKI